MRISLIIPAYNEDKRLGPFLNEVLTYVRSHRDQFREILLVDDGSDDETSIVANKYTNKLKMLRIITHKHNRGKGAAIQTGVKKANGDAIVFIDADGATSISELPKMLKALDQAQVAIGNRWMNGSKTVRHTAVRRMAGWVYRSYMRIFGLGAIDTMCGFKGYHRAVAKDLFADLLEERWLFDTEVAFKAIKRGYSVNNFPIRWESKDGSKLTGATLIKSSWQIWPLIRKINKQEK